MKCNVCHQSPCICDYFKQFAPRSQRDEDAEVVNISERQQLPSLEELFDRSVELGYIKPIATYQAAA